VRHVAIPEFDFVFVDETQDLNPSQLALVRKAAVGGRLVAVGDRHQSIYGFRGADPEAIPRIIRETSANVLPLSVTYRCASRIVAEANRYVPELMAAPGAPDGVVRSTMLDDAENAMMPGDFVLSRTNAPLVALCFRLAKQGRRAAIQGRDIGEGLAAWVRSTNATSIPVLAECVRSWHRAEVARLDALERDTDGVSDRAECLHAFCEGASNVSEVLGRIATVFSGEGGAADRVLLSSTHRAKGLEADRVFMLRDTYLKRETVEEKNLAYVAVTRAKHELVYVFDEK
jgi:DNA helicase II / ATP-dependent DNA helicase PcrA